jgi:hypothetical protein
VRSRSPRGWGAGGDDRDRVPFGGERRPDHIVGSANEYCTKGTVIKPKDSRWFDRNPELGSRSGGIDSVRSPEVGPDHFPHIAVMIGTAPLIPERRPHSRSGRSRLMDDPILTLTRVRFSTAPVRAGQALRLRSLAPIRPHVRADYAAPGSDRFRAKADKRSFIRPAIGIDDRDVMAAAGRAVDQQVPDPSERIWPSVTGGSRYGCGPPC